MASVDKIYGTQRQYYELLEFFKARRLKSFIQQMCPPYDDLDEFEVRPLCNLTVEQDGLLLTKHRYYAPRWLILRILKQYGYVT